MRGKQAWFDTITQEQQPDWCAKAFLMVEAQNFSINLESSFNKQLQLKLMLSLFVFNRERMLVWTLQTEALCMSDQSCHTSVMNSLD